MKNIWNKISLEGKPKLVRIWLLTARLSVLYYLIKNYFVPEQIEMLPDFAIFAYGAGSLGILLLIYGFDWGK